MEISKEDFRSDEGGTPEWDFEEMMKAGQSYLDLPVPREFITPSSLESLLPPAKIEEINKKRKEAQQLLRYISPQYLSVMVNTDIGLGTDPERLEQHLLNKMRQVLDRNIFAICLFCPGFSETVQTVHTITEESQLSNGKKIDFGIAGGFEGVQLGFEVANETSDWSHNRRIIAIADLRYQWAVTSSRIHRNKLYKFLTKDCKEAILKINGDRVTSELSRELSSFIGKYGTHVVLECTHGYRMEKVERMEVKSATKLQDFKADIMASVLGYAGINAGYQQRHLEADERTENSLGIKNIGSKEHMKEAVEGVLDIDFEKMLQYSSEGGDAGVISHDWNMMIAEMLLAENSPYTTAAKRLQYWTHVRINDLKAGWNEGLFATSYELKFAKDQQTEKKFSPLTRTKKINRINDKGICVLIGGRTVVHQHLGNEAESYDYLTNVHCNEAKSVRITVLDDELKLKEVLSKITVYRRVLKNPNALNNPRAEGALNNAECALNNAADEGALINADVEGLVVKTEIKTSFVDKPEVELTLPDLEEYYNQEPRIREQNWEATGELQRRATLVTMVNSFVTIGMARARVCRHN